MDGGDGSHAGRVSCEEEPDDETDTTGEVIEEEEDGTGFPFVGEQRGESDGDEEESFVFQEEEDDEEEDDDGDRDGFDMLLTLLSLDSRTERSNRMKRSLRLIGAAPHFNSSVFAGTLSGAAIMDCSLGGGCSGGGDDVLLLFVTLTRAPDMGFRLCDSRTFLDVISFSRGVTAEPLS